MSRAKRVRKARMRKRRLRRRARDFFRGGVLVHVLMTGAIHSLAHRALSCHLSGDRLTFDDLKQSIVRGLQTASAAKDHR